MELVCFYGVGFDANKTKLDVLKGNTAYDFSSVTGNVNTKSGRKSIKKQVRGILDGVYETEARKRLQYSDWATRPMYMHCFLREQAFQEKSAKELI